LIGEVVTLRGTLALAEISLGLSETWGFVLKIFKEEKKMSDLQRVIQDAKNTKE